MVNKYLPRALNVKKYLPFFLIIHRSRCLFYNSDDGKLMYITDCIKQLSALSELCDNPAPISIDGTVKNFVRLQKVLDNTKQK